ncbi:MAG: aminotransferase class III-fold pyridoxal phosphate-dependent enzyme [Pseudomonadota bacterium]
MLHNITLPDAVADARARYATRRPKTQAAHREAARVMPGGNTRTVLYHGPFPLRVTGGEGAHLTDMDGHRYLDLLGEYTAGVFGHSHPAIRAAVTRGLDVGLNLGAHSELEADLAARVTARFPAIEQVRFTNSGTEANLLAVSLARAETGRDGILVFEGGYHGALMYFGPGGGPHVNAPFAFEIGTFNDVEGTRALLRDKAHELACVLVEPMLGSGGCIPGTPEFLSMLRQETAAADCHLIFDEVMTSRFGPHGAHGLHGITPDLVTLGKWVGGGVSFGAFGGRADLMALFDPSAPNALPHAGTFNNNTLSMSAGIAALSAAFTAVHAEALHLRGEQFRERSNAVFKRYGVAMSISGMGSLMNIHGVTGPVCKLADLRGTNDTARELIFLDLLERGIYIARRGFIALSLAVTDTELDGVVETLDDIVKERRTVLPKR